MMLQYTDVTHKLTILRIVFTKDSRKSSLLNDDHGKEQPREPRAYYAIVSCARVLNSEHSQWPILVDQCDHAPARHSTRQRHRTRRHERCRRWVQAEPARAPSRATRRRAHAARTPLYRLVLLFDMCALSAQTSKRPKIEWIKSDPLFAHQTTKSSSNLMQLLMYTYTA